MAVTETTPPEAPVEGGNTAPSPVRRSPGEMEDLLGTGDHTSIGRLYIGFALLLLIASLIARVVTGLDAATDDGILGFYEAMVSSSSLVALLFLGVVPLLLGLATIVVPLQVGSASIAFPRAAALAMWSWLAFGAVFVASVALDGGIGGGDYDASLLGNVSLGAVMAALGLGSVCVATTVVSHRPAGLTLSRVPLFSWAMLVASVVWILTLGSALASTVVGHLAAPDAPALFDNFATGLGWLLRAPAVYMLAIPVLGIAGDALSAATGRPLRNYGVFQAVIGAFGVLSFGAWAQAPESIDTVLWALWALAIFLPVLSLLGGFGESMRHAKVRFTAAVIGSLLAAVNILAAAVVGLLMALDTAGSGTIFDFGPTQLATAQTVFVFTAALAGALAGIAHWAPQIWGSPARDSMAAASIGMVDVGGGILGSVLAIEVFVQAGGKDTADAVFGGLEALGALLLLVGVVGSLVAYLEAARESSESSGDDEAPDGFTLEWQVPSPAVGGGRSAEIPVVSTPYPLYESEEDA